MTFLLLLVYHRKDAKDVRALSEKISLQMSSMDSMGGSGAMKDEITVDERRGMTEAQWAAFQKSTQGYGDQDENGIDLASLRRNLRLTPAQRLTRLQQAVNTLPRGRSNA